MGLPRSKPGRCGWKDDFAKEMARLLARTEFEPDLELVRSLYCLDASVVELPAYEDEHSVVRVAVDGVTVRFHEDSFWIRAVVEGTLTEHTLKALLASVLEKLSRFTRAEWTMHVPA